MKKFAMFAVLVMVGVGAAYASSLSVPWFVDGKDAAVGFPPRNNLTAATTCAIVYLHNTGADPVTCAIQYYTNNGDLLGPEAPNNTFVIKAQATVAFRPVASDPSSVAGGQESAEGLAVPNRPMRTDIDGGTKINGSAVISWFGSSGNVQGLLVQASNLDGTAAGRLTNWGTLLPPGI